MGEKTYYSQDGEPRTIHQMVRAEPEWAASRIQAGESALTRAAELEFERDQYREWWANLSEASREKDARISALTAEVRERCAAARERNRELAAAEARVAELEAQAKRMARLLLECRDALPAIPLASARLRGLDLTLANRVEAALEPWRITEPDAALAARETPAP